MNVNLTPLQLVLIAIVIMFLCLLLKHLVEADTSEPSKLDCIENKYTESSAPWNYCMENYPELKSDNCLNSDFKDNDSDSVIYDYCMDRYPRVTCQNPNVAFDKCTQNPNSYDKIASYCANNPKANPDECDETDLPYGQTRRMFYCYNKKATLKDCQDEWLDVYCKYSKNAKPNECTAPNAQEDYCQNENVTNKDTKFCDPPTE